MKLSQEYYNENLNLSYERLKNKCDYFDRGDELIAIDMAVQIRVLLHDTCKSTSLLTHLNKKNIDFVDTTFCDWETGFAHCSFGDGFSNNSVFQQKFPRYAFLHRHFEQHLPAKYTPLLEPSNNLITFDNWWLQNKVCKMNSNISFNRNEIVLTLCNKDGGAHYGEKINNSYFMLKENNKLGVEINGQTVETENIPLFVIVRQIAFEVLETLEPHLDH